MNISSDNQSSSSSSSPYAFSSFSDCLLAHSLVIDVHANVARFFQLFLTLLTILLFLRLFRKYKREPVAFHGNLLLLFGNVFLIYLLYCVSIIILQLRYVILYLFQRDSACSMLTPVWLACLTRAPQYLHLLAMPLLHFVIMAERVRATMFSADYEREGSRFAVVSLLITWSISLLFTGFVTLTMLSSNGWDPFQLLIFSTMVSPDNKTVVLVLHYVLWPLVFLTILADWRVFLLNRRALKISSSISGYNLSQTYQINENIVVMRLILPLDLSYAVLFTLYLLCSTILRMLPLNMTDFQIGYDWVNSLMLLHAVITMWLYSRFIGETRRRRKSGVKIKPFEQHAELYFRELRNQWQTQ